MYPIALSPKEFPSRKILGTFNIDDDDGDGCENVTLKINWGLFQLCRVYSISLKISNVGKFPWC